ncbi:uncharacterized protein LOC124114648 isoform X2 [Haliotis rufescens]|uniref:uncharacterized protein LOC124114648 isoform X2 n=1 Tax=Haliotis rufescens TaxID=6454 RepID=UPI00201EB934|nr:uncharacterized protein LOC124114648 isoform X2 [Haliotis rufescens]
MGLIISFCQLFFEKLFQKSGSRNKFEIEDGITLFDNEHSPCARRVRIALHEKKIPYKTVEVNLLTGENHHPDFVKISPNRKIPAIAFKNVQDVPDCVMFESSVIIEYLDTVCPGSRLYPVDPWERAQVKMWMDWELGLVDDHVPLVYQNTLPFILRLKHPSKEAYLKTVHPNMPKAKRDIFCRVYDGTHRTQEELEKHALACYQNLVVLETGLQDRQYLVGDRFTVADLTVLPRVRMFFVSGLPFTDKHFPNIVRYLKNLEGRLSFKASEKTMVRFSNTIMTKAPWLLVGLSNFKCGTKHKRFDGSPHIDRAIGETEASTKSLIEASTKSLIQASTKSLVQAKLPYVHKDDITVYNYPTSTEVWQVKILLSEKGVSYKSVDCPFIDLIGRAAGSGSVMRIQHGGRMVTGPRTVLEYLDKAFSGKKLLPDNPEQRSQVQCWQAWEQTMYFNELAPLVEMCIVSKVMVLRYEEHLDELLSLRGNPTYHAKFNSILRCFMMGLREDSPCWPQLTRDYGHLMDTNMDRRKKKELTFELLHIRLQHLEASLQDKTYLVGENLSLADICVFSRLALFAHVGMKISADRFVSSVIIIIIIIIIITWSK